MVIFSIIRRNELVKQVLNTDAKGSDELGSLAHARARERETEREREERERPCICGGLEKSWLTGGRGGEGGGGTTYTAQ